MRKRSRLLACAMIGALVLSGIPKVPSQAVGSAANTVYAGGNGTSEGSGDSASPLSSLYAAQDMLPEGGTIVVTSTIYVSGERSYSLNSGIMLKAAEDLEGPVFEVAQGGELTLNNIVIVGHNSTLISNNGVLKLDSSVSLQVEGSSTGVGCVYTGGQGSTYLDGSLVAGVAEKPKTESGDSNKDGTGQSETSQSGTSQTETGKDGNGQSETSQSETGKGQDNSSQTGQSETGQSETGKGENGQPQTGQSETGKGENDQPQTSQSETSQSETGKDGNGQSQTSQSETSQSETGKDGAGQPQTGQSETSQPETGKDGNDQPQTNQSETSQPETGKDGNGNSQSGGSDTKEPESGKGSGSQDEQSEAPSMAVMSQEVIALDKAVIALSVHSRDDIDSVVQVTKAYEALSEAEKAAIAPDTMKLLQSAQEMAAAYNHTQLGVTVYGNLPWYVQFRVALVDVSAEEEQGLKVLVPYELKLWNLYTDEAYALPEGESVTVTMPIPDVEIDGEFTIFHYKSDGSVETIKPVIRGNLMSFETSSFSPFSVAGSTVITGVGVSSGVGSSGSGTGGSTSGGSTSGSSSGGSSGSTGSSGQGNTSYSGSGSSGSTANVAVNTGDTTEVWPLVVAAVVALLVLAGTIVLKKKRK